MREQAVRTTALAVAAATFIAAASFLSVGRDVGAAATTVSIDTNTSGNSATAVGTIESCNNVASGSSLSVDIVIQNVISLAGFEADVLYNGSVVHVTGENSGFILMQPPSPPPTLIDLSSPVPDSDGKYDIAVSSTGNGAGSGIVIRLTLQGFGTGASVLDLTSVKMKDFNNAYVQPADAAGFFTGPINDASVVVGGACTTPSTDSDGDGVPDASDNCPRWANPAQNSPPWPVPPNDPDCDGFSNTTESDPDIGTDPNDPCPNTATANDESDDKWTADFNDNQVVNTLDLTIYATAFNKLSTDPGYVSRADLNQNGVINSLDLVPFASMLNKTCGP